MKSAYELPEAIQWHEGMLLAPQHLQQAFMRQEALLAYHLAAAVPYHWGVRHLRIDPVLLVNGTLRVAELEAVLPDGLPVRHGGGDESGLEVDLRAALGDAKRALLTVHLAVPAGRAPGEPYAGGLQRFRSVPGLPVADENTGEGQLTIPRLRPRVTLLVTERAPEKFVSFPLAKVAFEDDTFRLSDYVPPRLSLPPQSELGEACTQLARRLREKARFLAEKVHGAGSTREARIGDLQATVQQLVEALPPLEAVLGAGVVHPFGVYLSLCTLAGHLSGIEPGQVPPAFRPYDHDDLRGSFAPVLEFCGRMLDRVHESYQVVAFHFSDNAFQVALPADWGADSLVVGAVGRPDFAERDLVDWMEAARIGSEPRMPSIKDRRIRGAGRKRIDAADDLGVVPGRGVVLFRIPLERDFIQPGTVLQVAHPAEHTGALRPVELLLYAGRQP